MPASGGLPGSAAALLLVALVGAGCAESDLPGGPPSGSRNASARQAAGQTVERRVPDGAPGGEVPGVVTAIATRQVLDLEIEAVGSANAKESVDITSKASNTVTAIRFEEGQLVRRGAVLVEFDSAQATADVAAAEAALVESEAQYARSQSLAATQALSVAELGQIEATVKANRARVAAAKARESDTVIRAPFAGRTGFRRVSLGSFVSPGSVITTLDDTSIIKLDFTVSQTYLHLLRQKLPIKAQTAGLPGREFVGRVTAVGSRVDPATRSITVRAELANEDDALKPGLFMTVRLSTAAAPALLVPEAALVPERGKTFVFVVQNERAAKREVTIGRRRPGAVEIIAGLADQERVIVEGTQKVRDKARVREVTLAPVAADS